MSRFSTNKASGTDILCIDLSLPGSSLHGIQAKDQVTLERHVGPVRNAFRRDAQNTGGARFRIRTRFALLRNLNPSLFAAVIQGRVPATFDLEPCFAKDVFAPMTVQTRPVWTWRDGMDMPDFGRKGIMCLSRVFPRTSSVTILGDRTIPSPLLSGPSTHPSPPHITLTPPRHHPPPPATPPHSETLQTQSPHCSICLDQYPPIATLRTIPCGHSFHVVRIDTWLCSRAEKCPVCRRDVARGGGGGGDGDGGMGKEFREDV
ncbi:hypothetical protein M427DRAFT_30947 [Gonapodya prolifera JEL478]|uniref:RING-type domain-containing protein n=1 Tax=Gonapodya prolifera (strain JEL478) TaxID=1344416 RepID=A0A139AJG0_GONPJ|nr:hypothetical protein M427DRAFT_30947 [Gonapodya prolifera JEL478]|eukprot:KXS16838.1 hypothetical protein M427DRAFT_30947 [Gonapodya prolifera JEL478]